MVHRDFDTDAQLRFFFGPGKYTLIQNTRAVTVERYSVSKGWADTYRIVLSERSGWADISVEESQGGGSFRAVSDFGTFSHVWANIGGKEFKEFLLGLEFDYFMEKTVGTNYIEFDLGGTINEIKIDILRLRKQRKIRKCEARSFYNRISSTIFNNYDNIDDYYNYLEESGIVEEMYMRYLRETDLPTVYRYNSDCLAFWELIWPCFCDALKKEIRADIIQFFE